MSYEPTVWSTGDVVTAAKLNKLENGLADIQSDIEEEISEIVPAIYSQYPQKSISSTPIASFADGADNVPLKALEVEIEPVQDLHGYESPWPAGGSANKFSEQMEAGRINLTTGVDTTGNGLRSTAYDAVLPSTSYRAVVPSSTAGTVVVCYYDSNGDYLSYAVLGGGVFTTPDNAATFRLNIQTSSPVDTYTNSYHTSINYPDTVTQYVPSANICPISGFDSVEVTRTGKNLLDASNITWTAGIRNDSGEIISGQSHFTNAIHGIEPNTDYTVSGTLVTSSSQFRIYYLKKSGEWISRSEGIGIAQIPYAFTTPANCGAIQIQVIATINDLDDVQIEKGSSASEYEPFGLSITIPLGSTVFGGKIKIVDGAADMTLTHELKNLRNWPDDRIISYDYNSQRGGQVITFHGAYFQYVINKNVSRIPGLCNMAYVSTANDPGADYSHWMWFGVNSGIVFWIGILDALNMTLEEFKTWVHANDLYVWVELAEPITTTLTPAQLTTLLGQNNIFANSGNVSLTYRADPSTYNAEQIQSMLNAMVAPVEPTATASKAYSVNDFLIMDNVLYKVISPIANGGTITIDTNVSATTVGEQLTAILNS